MDIINDLSDEEFYQYAEITQETTIVFEMSHFDGNCLLSNNVRTLDVAYCDNLYFDLNKNWAYPLVETLILPYRVLAMNLDHCFLGNDIYCSFRTGVHLPVMKNLQRIEFKHDVYETRGTEVSDVYIARQGNMVTWMTFEEMIRNSPFLEYYIVDKIQLVADDANCSLKACVDVHAASLYEGD